MTTDPLHRQLSMTPGTLPATCDVDEPCYDKGQRQAYADVIHLVERERAQAGHPHTAAVLQRIAESVDRRREALR